MAVRFCAWQLKIMYMSVALIYKTFFLFKTLFFGVVLFSKC